MVFFTENDASIDPTNINAISVQNAFEDRHWRLVYLTLEHSACAIEAANAYHGIMKRVFWYFEEVYLVL